MSTSELVEDRQEVGLLQTPELLWENADLRLVWADSEDRKDLLRPVARRRAGAAGGARVQGGLRSSSTPLRPNQCGLPLCTYDRKGSKRLNLIDQ